VEGDFPVPLDSPSALVRREQSRWSLKFGYESGFLTSADTSESGDFFLHRPFVDFLVFCFLVAYHF
jgi:hypothetical protein